MKDNSFGTVRPESIKKVYHEIARNNGITRADLAQSTGISLMTISRITDFFYSVKMTAEFQKRSGTIGRKPSLIHINSKDYGCVVDLSVSHFKAYFLAPGNKAKRELQYSCVPGLRYEENAQIFMKKLSEYLRRGPGRSHCLGVALLYPRPSQNPSFFEGSKQMIRDWIKGWYPNVRMFEMDYVDAAALHMLALYPELAEKTYLYVDMRQNPEGVLVSRGKIVRGENAQSSAFSDLRLSSGVPLAESLRVHPYGTFLKHFAHFLLPTLLVLSPDALILDTNAFYRSRVVEEMMKEAVAEEMGANFCTKTALLAPNAPPSPAVLHAMDHITDTFLDMVIEKTRF